MARKSAVLIPVIIAAVAVGALGVAFVPKDIRDRDTSFPKGTVRIDNDVITVEIAETAAQQQRWMTFRQDRLPLDTAMLIKQDKSDLDEVWMLNIAYNLAWVWLDESGEIDYVITNDH